MRIRTIRRPLEERGAVSIAVVVHAAQALGATGAHLLKYATSADIYPDKSRVVGYAAVAFN